MSRQRLGQHFLKDKKVLQAIARELKVEKKEALVEVGGGHGELTTFLKEFTPHSFSIIEKDGRLATMLQKKYPEIEVVLGDVLEELPILSARFQKEKTIWKLAGNIPYYLTGQLFRLLSELEYKPHAAVFVIQKEVAERLLSRPPHMNRLAASVQFWAAPKAIASISRKSFSPPPQVDSAAIILKTGEKRTKEEGRRYFNLVRTIFAQPRKTILNNLLSREDDSKEEIEKALKKLKIRPQDRPANLSVEELLLLAKDLSF